MSPKRTSAHFTLVWYIYQHKETGIIQAGWRTPIFLALGGLRQEHHQEFEASQSHEVSSRTACTTKQGLSQKQNKAKLEASFIHHYLSRNSMFYLDFVTFSINMLSVWGSNLGYLCTYCNLPRVLQPSLTFPFLRGTDNLKMFPVFICLISMSDA